MNKKLVQINVTCNGSTGRIMNQIQQEAISQGWEAYSFFGRGKPSNEFCYKIGNAFDTLFHVFITRVFNLHGHASKLATKKMINQIKKINPDVIHLHNIHGYYLNIQILFKYLKKCNKKIIWTLHDCWAFTGHCTHFTMAGCNKWKTQCNECSQKKSYPKTTFIDTSKSEYIMKKELFTGIKNMTIVTPSNWLANLVKESFLKEYPIYVIYNGIDLNVFKPTHSIDVRKKYNIPDNIDIILGVSSIWNKNKGFNDFIELSKFIDKDKIIVLVGLNSKQMKALPNNIVGIGRTENIEELANLYTVATVLFNPSKEETFSLVTAEAMACGTPVIVYDNSAVSEIVNEKNSLVINEYNIDTNIKKIIDFTVQSHNFTRMNNCKYSIETMLEKYFNLYCYNVI